MFPPPALLTWRKETRGTSLPCGALEMVPLGFSPFIAFPGRGGVTEVMSHQPLPNHRVLVAALGTQPHADPCLLLRAEAEGLG